MGRPPLASAYWRVLRVRTYHSRLRGGVSLLDVQHYAALRLVVRVAGIAWSGSRLRCWVPSARHS